MTLQALNFRPGVSRESTDYANQGGWYACEKIRFRSGMPENLGGWTPITVATYKGMCRNIMEWETLAEGGFPIFLLTGVGTNLKYYVLSNQTYYDITPFELFTSVNPTYAIPSNPFIPLYTTISSAITASDTTIYLASGTAFTHAAPLVIRIGTEDIYVPYASANTLSGCTRGYNGTTATAHASGSIVSSTWVVVHSPANSSGVGNFVSFVNATAFGPYTSAELNRDFQIKAQSTDYIVIDTGVQATSATVGGGSTVIGYYEIDVGADASTFGQGWGAGVWESLVVSGGSTTLTAAVSASATTLTVSSTASFASSGYVMIEAEVIQYSGKTSTSFTGCTRSTENFKPHGAGAEVIAVVVPSSITPRGWNTPAESGVNIPLRIWSSDNFGEDLVLNVRDGGVYYWKKAVNMTAAGSTIPLPLTSPLAISDPTGHAVNIKNLVLNGFPSDAWAPAVASRVLVSDQRHIVVLGTNDWALESSTQDTMLVRWSEQEDPLTWEPTQTNTAGSQRLSYGSKLITAEKTREEILIWSDSALYSMRYLGPPYTFGFNVLSNEITIAGPNASITANNITYWMGIDKFYVYSGTVDTLPCSLRQYIFDDINNAQLDQVYAGTNEKYNEIWWVYCSAGSTQVDRYVIYNYLEKLWYYGQLPRSAWYDSHIRTHSVAAYPKVAAFTITAVDENGGIATVSLNQSGEYETLPDAANVVVGGSGAGAALYVTYSATGATSAIISMPGQGYSVGELVTVTGGIPLGTLLLHDYGVDDATNPADPVPIFSYIESADFDIGDGEQFTFIKRLIPDVDFIGSTAANPSATMTVSTRNYPGQGLYTTNDSRIVATSSKVSIQVYNYTNDFWIRLRGRQAAFRIGSDSLGVKWQLGVPRITVQPDGRR